MLYVLPNRLRPILLLLAPLLAIFAARMATHSEIAARYPRTAALCFLWIAADSLTLALIAKAPRNRPQLRAVLGAIATGFLVATLGAADPVRAALLDIVSGDAGIVVGTHALFQDKVAFRSLAVAIVALGAMFVNNARYDGASPVPVPSRYRLRPGSRLSSTSVPVGFLPTMIGSPTFRCCSFEVSGPSWTLIEKNSSSSS